MKSKLKFFSKRAAVSADKFHFRYREILVNAYESRYNNVASAKFYLALQGADLDVLVISLISMEMVGVTLPAPLKDAIFFPAGCGDTANAFCLKMTGDSMQASCCNDSKSLSELPNELNENLPKLIRLDIPGHSYVMLASEYTAEGTLGYIFQSNGAEGMEDNIFSITAWQLDKKSDKTNLSEHVNKLIRLVEPCTSNEEKASIYRELYFAKPIVKVIAPADTDQIIEYFNENPTVKYKAKPAHIQNMLKTLEEMKRKFDSSREQRVSLEEYIDKVKEKCEKQAAARSRIK